MNNSALFLHGASSGGDVWSGFKNSFETAGWRCETPTLYAHLRTKIGMPPLPTVHQLSMTDYLRSAADYAEQLMLEDAMPPVVIGYGMGAIIAQHLIANGMASAGVFISPIASHVSARLLLRDKIRHILKTTQPPQSNALSRQESQRVLEQLSDIHAYDLNLTDQHIRSIRTPVLIIGAARAEHQELNKVRKIAKSWRKAKRPADYLELPQTPHQILGEKYSAIAESEIHAWLDYVRAGKGQNSNLAA